MVREENGKIILDNLVEVELMTEDLCPKCKKNQSNSSLCHDCLNNEYPYESVLTLGYYYRKWYNEPDRYVNGLINPKYRFSKLINDAKERSRLPFNRKKRIIKNLCKGLAFKLNIYDNEAIKKIDVIVHVPKKNERAPNAFNHGFYYAKYLSEEINIPFKDKIVVEDEESTRSSRSYSIREPKSIQGKNILIVDDVYTDGSTKGLISELLKIEGANEIYIAVVARSIWF